MTKAPQILAIYIASTAGDPMVKVGSVELTRKGIQGDRYENGNGAYSTSVPSKVRHISIITTTGIATANEYLAANGKPAFTAEQTRRNILIDEISADALNNLVGHEFYLGQVLLRGVELCTPCQRPANLVNKPDFINAFEGRGGLRAEIITTGTITIGDQLHQESKTHDSLPR